MIIYHTSEFLSTLTAVIATYLKYFIQSTQAALQNKVEDKKKKDQNHKTQATLTLLSCFTVAVDL